MSANDSPIDSLVLATAARDARAFAQRETRRRIVADLADPAFPTADPRVLAEAVEVATRRIKHFSAVIERAFGNGILDPGAAPGYAFEALIAWGKAETKAPGSVENIWRYVDGVVHNLISRDVDCALRVVDPGARALRRTEQRMLQRVGGPELDERARRLLAADLARESLMKRGASWVREAFDDAVEQEPGGEDPLGEVVLRALLTRIRALLRGRRYSAIDRLTWACFEAAGYRGRDIDWPSYGVARHVGQQRLHSLTGKLARDLEDWNPGVS